MRITVLQRIRSFLLVRLESSSVTSKMQVFTQKRNPITGSTEWDVQHEDYDFHQEIARSAFADMLHDTERNKKYHRALQLAIEKMHEAGKKANVLDIGTGTGLLSIMAARCGADTVTACEAFKPMAECCLKILQRNGVADKITVIPKRSTDMTVGEDGDMKEKANILVTEVFDTELIGEGALSTFSHAHKYLLEEDCIVVPDSAVIYAQVVECPMLQKWNKLNDLADEDLEIILRTPQKMKECAGSAAVHDVQLSQLPRHAFRELSDQIPVFYYDWSGRSPIDMKRTVKQEFTVSNTGQAQMVFMWWELNMDPEGKICLSCAPWWTHPDADLSSERPQDSIPWRDHWMQAVYYLPQELTVQKDSELSLVSCQDEYSLWFYLEDEKSKRNHYKRPICECGVHMSISRTHVSYLNDGKRSKKLLAQLKEVLVRDAVVLDLNGSSFLGLAAAKMGANTVYIIENMNLNIGILNDYIKENDIQNAIVLPEVTDEVLEKVTNIVCDLNFSSAILPWENLKAAYLLYRYRSKLKELVPVLPEGCEFWAMPVEFQDLHKIRIPLGMCEGIDMSIFDSLVESSRVISDAEIEAQPLWEYPCRCRGVPRKLIDIHFKHLTVTYASDGAHPVVDSKSEGSHSVNGFAIWAVWIVGGKAISSGPVEWPVVGDRVDWDMHTRQAVKILKTSKIVSDSDKWSYQVACDLEKGQFNLNLDWVNEES
ncbi:protein arginine N-methyltransferase 7-like isoform X1 [Maniola hyperantus]|uniref:protein arginine N-methyltransferase 7-like isoform X1 n=2 Tax=Aphantopus hyperantus TaxID=2795564 RepID=UPI00156867CB|nr:protein arginine N-methyltransferase 7-like isoform X2 [Maniola hyperantus]